MISCQENKKLDVCFADYTDKTKDSATKRHKKHKKRFPSFALVPFVPLWGSFLFCVIGVICGFSPGRYHRPTRAARAGTRSAPDTDLMESRLINEKFRKHKVHTLSCII